MNEQSKQAQTLLNAAKMVSMALAYSQRPCNNCTNDCCKECTNSKEQYAMFEALEVIYFELRIK